MTVGSSRLRWGATRDERQQAKVTYRDKGSIRGYSPDCGVSNRPDRPRSGRLVPLQLPDPIDKEVEKLVATATAPVERTSGQEFVRNLTTTRHVALADNQAISITVAQYQQGEEPSGTKGQVPLKGRPIEYRRKAVAAVDSAHHYYSRFLDKE